MKAVSTVSVQDTSLDNALIIGRTRNEKDALITGSTETEITNRPQYSTGKEAILIGTRMKGTTGKSATRRDMSVIRGTIRGIWTIGRTDIAGTLSMIGTEDKGMREDVATNALVLQATLGTGDDHGRLKTITGDAGTDTRPMEGKKGLVITTSIKGEVPQILTRRSADHTNIWIQGWLGSCCLWLFVRLK